MSDEKFKNKYRIKSARAVWHDYNGGIYFITVCTKNREHFFGEINNGNIQLTKIGEYVSENLEGITDHYPYAEIPLFVVMPNHWHAIVFIDAPCRGVACNVFMGATNEANNNGKDVACNVFTGITNGANNGKDVARNVSTNEKMVEIAKRQSLLCVTIRGIKSAVTRFANDNNIDFAWQTRFHDHIIRNQNEINRIADYIENNPANWDTNCFNEKNNVPSSPVETGRAPSLRDGDEYIILKNRKKTNNL